MAETNKSNKIETKEEFIAQEIRDPEIVMDWTGNPDGPRILMIYTGGTIGMGFKKNPNTGEDELVPELQLEQLLETANAASGLLDRYNILGYKVAQIDSTEILPIVWENIAKTVKKHYKEIEGVVVLHGTDTMAYSAAATAFALRNLALPIVFTGAQMTTHADGTDVIGNLTGALAVAKSDFAECGVYFDGSLFKATRVDKDHDTRLQGFASSIYGPVGHVGGHGVELGANALLRGRHTISRLEYNPSFSQSVLEITMNPTLAPSVLEQAMNATECKALVLRTYGPGNVARWFYPLIEKKTEEGFPVFLTSQCGASGISIGGSSYAVGTGAVRAGAIPLGDMVGPSAVAKLSNIVEKYPKREDLVREMLTPYADEITIRMR